MDIRKYFYHCKIDICDESDICYLLKGISNISLRVQKGTSVQLRKIILDNIHLLGWSSTVKLSHTSQIAVTAMKKNFALCIQTGNISRIYADLLKLEYLYRKGKIDTAIYILPTRKNALLLGSNIANFERLVSELLLFEGIITAPILVLGID